LRLPKQFPPGMRILTATATRTRTGCINLDLKEHGFARADDRN